LEFALCFCVLVLLRSDWSDRRHVASNCPTSSFLPLSPHFPGAAFVSGLAWPKGKLSEISHTNLQSFSPAEIRFILSFILQPHEQQNKRGRN